MSKKTDWDAIQRAAEKIKNPGGGMKLVSHGFQPAKPSYDSLEARIRELEAERDAARAKLASLERATELRKKLYDATVEERDALKDTLTCSQVLVEHLKSEREEKTYGEDYVIDLRTRLFQAERRAENAEEKLEKVRHAYNVAVEGFPEDTIECWRASLWGEE